MALQHWQLGLLHTVPKALGIDDDHRRLILRNMASPPTIRRMDQTGEWSSKYLSQQDFAQVMAFYESCGWVDERHGRNHWTQIAAQADTYRQRCKVIKQADVLGWTLPNNRVDFTRIDAFVQRMTKGRCRHLAHCDSRELFVIIEALKKMIGRLEGAA